GVPSFFGSSWARATAGASTAAARAATKSEAWIGERMVSVMIFRGGLLEGSVGARLVVALDARLHARVAGRLRGGGVRETSRVVDRTRDDVVGAARLDRPVQIAAGE